MSFAWSREAQQRRATWSEDIEVEKALVRRLSEHDVRRPRGADATSAAVQAWERDREAIVRAIHVNARRVTARPSPVEQMGAGLTHFNVRTRNLTGGA